MPKPFNETFPKISNNSHFEAIEKIQLPFEK
jgi:hypothetical protein